MSSDGENVKRQDRAADEATETPATPVPNLSADHDTAGKLTIAKPGTFSQERRRAGSHADRVALARNVQY
jgi:hypothetical protein